MKRNRRRGRKKEEGGRVRRRRGRRKKQLRKPDGWMYRVSKVPEYEPSF